MIGEVTDKARVLVKENISSLGVDLLREHFEVDVRTDMTDQELKQEINEYDGLIIRSSTQATADILEGSRRLKVIGRAGTGVDNIDVAAATEKGIVVANAPESNACLLYTSDAADDLTRVDLGGRRIIKKKNTK